MYNEILVPVDGSKLAECVLPHVQAIANGCEVTEVTFLRVLEPVGLPATTYITVEDLRRMEEAQKKAAQTYLGKLVGGLDYKARAKTEIVQGDPAGAIARYAEKNGVDLIVIATHGRSGVSRWVWGSIADRVLRSSCVPVFMVRAPGCVPGI